MNLGQSAGQAQQTPVGDAFMGSLRDILAGMAMGTTPNESMSYAGKMMATRGAEREKEAKTKAQQSQTLKWLQGKGMDAGTASYLASDPVALRAFIGESIKGKTPNWQLHDLDDGKYMIDMNDPTRRQKISDPKQPKPTFGVIGEDEYGKKTYGWIDPFKQTTTPLEAPAEPAAATPAASSAIPPPAVPAPAASAMPALTIPPPPPGADAKKWRETYTKEAAERASVQPSRDKAAAKTAGLVIQDIDRAISTVDNATLPATGATGAALSYIGGTAAHDVSKLLDTVKANAGFAELQKMREASPTGGALGNVTEQEIKFLQSTVGSLEQSQSEAQFKDNLRRVKNAYLDIIHGEGKGPPREPLGFQQKTQAGPSIDDLVKKYAK